MKMKVAGLFLFVLGTSLCFAQDVGNSSASGLIPTTVSFDVNTNNNNTGTESLGVAIGANTNVLVAWEDDYSAATAIDSPKDTEAIWSVYDANGNRVTASTTLTDYTGTNTVLAALYRAFYRDNGTATPGNVAWGPKVKANLFGNGIGMGGNAMEGQASDGFFYGMGLEIPRFFGIANDNNNSGADFGDFPAVQLLNNDGSKAANALSGVTEADAEPLGSIRLGDWEYLANGNIVIVGESRQAADRVLTGQTSGNVPVFRIVTPAGVQVKGYTAISSAAIGGSMWHGVGVTANGFAVRWSADTGGATVRMFDNAGNPTTANINLTTLTGQNQGGDRGDSSGFHGNGNNAYVNISTVNPGTGNTPWVTVLNANGTLRYSRAVGDTGDLPFSERVDAAIAPEGLVIAVFDDTRAIGVRLPYARMFDANGVPASDVFSVSERDNPANAIAYGRRPRAAWRGTTVAIVWESRNSPVTTSPVLAARFFDVTNYLSIARSGANNTLTWLGSGTLQAAPYVTGPYCDIGGTSPVSRPITRKQEYYRLRN